MSTHKFPFLNCFFFQLCFSNQRYAGPIKACLESVVGLFKSCNRVIGDFSNSFHFD